jgi:hypothetical protein
VNQSLVGTTVKAATQIAAGQAATGIVSSEVATLTEGVVRAMLLRKLKTVGALLLMVTFLSVGVGAMRPTAAAEEEGTSKAAPQVPLGLLPKAAAPLPGRRFLTAFKISELKDGDTKVIGEPKLVTLNGRTASVTVGQDSPVRLHGRVDFVTSGLTATAKVSSDALGTDLDLTVTRATATVANDGTLVGSESVRLLREIELNKPLTVELKSKDKHEPIIRVTATVSEVRIRTDNTIEAAERDFKVAEFYLKNGRHESAQFVYELILRRYPGTLYARQAREKIAVLKKDQPVWPPERKDPDQIDEILIINSTKLKLEESVILEKLRLEPGQPLTLQRLLKAETRLLQSGLFENPPKIHIDCEGDQNARKKLIVTIEE